MASTSEVENGCSGRVLVQWWVAQHPFKYWSPLSAAGLVDQSRRPTHMRLRPFTLAPETYNFKVTATYEAALSAHVCFAIASACFHSQFRLCVPTQASESRSERIFEVQVVSRRFASLRKHLDRALDLSLRDFILSTCLSAPDPSPLFLGSAPRPAIVTSSWKASPMTPTQSSMTPPRRATLLRP